MPAFGSWHSLSVKEEKTARGRTGFVKNGEIPPRFTGEDGGIVYFKKLRRRKNCRNDENENLKK